MLFCQLQGGCLPVWIAVSYSGEQGKPGWVAFWLVAFKNFECSTTRTVLCLQIQNVNLCSPSVRPEGILRDKTAVWLWRLAADSRNALKQIIDTNWFWCFSSSMGANKERQGKKREREKDCQTECNFFSFFMPGFGYVHITLVSDSVALRC